MMRPAETVTSRAVAPQANNPINNAHTSVLAVADIVLPAFYFQFSVLDGAIAGLRLLFSGSLGEA